MDSINYYEVGSKTDIVISNTSLSYINPEQGGSPAKFIDFFEKFVEFLNSVSLERGSLLHDYHEHQENFVISDVEKPSTMMAGWIERIFEAYKHTDHTTIDWQYDNIEPYLNGAYANPKLPEKRLQKFKDEGLPYLNFLFEANGKVAMTPATKEMVTKSMDALKGHKKANHILFGETPEGIERIKELEIYWSKPLEGTDKRLKFKAKLDNTIFDYTKKIVYLNDLKSTGKPVSKFKQSFVNYRYYRQITFYMQAIYEYLEQNKLDPKEWSIIARIVAVDSTPFYNVHVFTIDQKWIEQGSKEIRELVERIAWHIVNEEWKYTAEEVADKYDSYIDYNKKDELFNSEEE